MTGKICAVVPAAGRGSRLGGDAPKVFVPILPSLTVWDAIRNVLGEVSDRIVLILSPDGREFISTNRAQFPEEKFAKTEIATQLQPLGMGDAIFGAAKLWREYDNILVVWGDQFNLSLETLRACAKLQAPQKKPAVTLPVVRIEKPYVEYVFDAKDRLTEVKQSREGDDCRTGGLADVGVFLLSGGEPLMEEWSRYQKSRLAGSVTGEVNFLPFLAHLSSVAGWPVSRYETGDAAEAVGINTPEDLAFARALFQARTRPSGESS
jgi:bifunctional UDP-N-acetylglucosamine pyrophosphorylase/glucosamine-1-phosphate N-acetyltransferase